MIDFRGLAAGMLAFGVVVAPSAYAPTASAEPEPGQDCSQQGQQQPPPDGKPQQCQQQGPGMPQLPNNNGQNNSQQKQNRLSDFNCWMYPTGPVWPPLGTAPPPESPGEPPAVPCYYALGLQPTVPGS